MGELLDQLELYSQKGAYPFHMPGHKRNMEGAAPFFAEWFRRDFTEIPGLDDLHAPEGILKEAQERAAGLYGAKQSFYLVNGSTAGVLAAISAAVPRGGTILLHRASHRSAYHAVQLRNLSVKYLYGRQASLVGAGKIGMGIAVEEVRDIVEAHPGIDAVFLTSPTYDGFSSNITEIAEYLHRKKIPLIVDAAHGAHLGFSEYFPKSALQCGADVVVMSVHKTLPAPTQTALLHLSGERISAEDIQRFLSIYQTSSPSYLLMAAIDECVERVSGWDNKVWQEFYERRKHLSERLHGLKHIGIWDTFGRSTAPKQSLGAVPEPGKILIFPPDGKSGVALGEQLSSAGIQCEMALPAYVLLICTVMDTEEGYERLAEELENLDKDTFCERVPVGDAAGIMCSVIREGFAEDHKLSGQQGLTIADAVELPAEKMLLSDAKGRISAGFVSVYPPGQPLLVPGETITGEMIKEIEKLFLAGAALRGISQKQRFSKLQDQQSEKGIQNERDQINGNQ